MRADVTVTFHAAKPGLWIMPGKATPARCATIDIGIPRGAPIGARVGLMRSAGAELLPRRASDSTKFASGQVVVAGGSRGLTGAPRMAAHAAMRAGAGYVIACVPASLQDVLVERGPARADDARRWPKATARSRRRRWRRRARASARAERWRSARASGAAIGAVAFARALARARRRRWCSTPTG